MWRIHKCCICFNTGKCIIRLSEICWFRVCNMLPGDSGNDAIPRHFDIFTTSVLVIWKTFIHQAELTPISTTTTQRTSNLTVLKKHSHDHLNFMTKIPHILKDGLYIKTGLCSLSENLPFQWGITPWLVRSILERVFRHQSRWLAYSLGAGQAKTSDRKH